MHTIMRLFKEEDGQGMTEYALIIALVAVVLITALATFRGKIAAVFNDMKFSE